MRSKQTTPNPSSYKKGELRKSLGLVQATIYGVGIILGAGIYALIGEAAGIAGNSTWMSFVFAAFIALFTAFSYAELTTVFPKSAAEFVYVQETTENKTFAFFIGYVSIITGIISASAVALGFAAYGKLFISINPSFIATGIIIILTLINLKGIQESAFLNTIFTLIEVGGLIFVIVIGWRFVGNVNLFTDINNNIIQSFEQFNGVIAASGIIFFAYIGFEDVANISEETKNPKKVIPVALMLSLLISTLIYILISIVSVSVVEPQQLALSSHNENVEQGPLAIVVSQALNNPEVGKYFTFVALFATANTILVLLIVSSRMMYGIAREKCLPALLGHVSVRTQTPIASIILSSVIAVAFVFAGDLGKVAKLTNLGVFLVFFAVNLSLIIHRYKNRQQQTTSDDVFRSPVNYKWFPVMAFIGMCFCLAMLLTQYWEPITFFGMSIPLLIFGMLIFITAFPIYWIFNTSQNKFDVEL